MTDNLFDRLADLFRSSGPVNWKLAKEIAESVAGPSTPVDPWAADQFRELAATAQRLLAASTPLDATAITSGVSVVDSRTWAADGLEGLRYLAEPISERMAAVTGDMAPLLGPMGPSLLGMQVGSLVGLTSRRVFGQFDRTIMSGDATPITFVAETIDRFGSDAALDPSQVRMWAALNEVAHHAAFAVPWVREHLHMLGDAHAEALDMESSSLEERLRLLQDPEAIQRLLAGESDGTFDHLEPASHTSDATRRLVGFMSFLEGYAAVAAKRAGSAYLPDLELIETAAAEHRVEADAAESLLRGALGIVLDGEQSTRGTTFCREVGRRWGTDALDRVWDSPDSVPSPDELDDPTGWAARVLL